MSLQDIYSNQVNKTSINQAGISSGIPATRERDPNLVKLETDVFSQMSDLIVKQDQEDIKDDQKDNKVVDKVRHVGFEDALKELSDLFESGNNKL